MSVTPFRSRRTTSFAFMSRQSWAARCTRCAPSRAETDGRDVAMRFSEGFFAAQIAAPYVAYQPCESSVRGSNSHFARHLLVRKRPGGVEDAARSSEIGVLLLDDPDFDLG